jgi:type IV secretory pathway VirB2 component (pilin)
MSESKVVLNLKKDKSGVIAIVGAGVAAAAIAYESPASAQSTPSNANIDAVSTMITSLGGIAAAVTVVVLGAMGVRMAIKLVNRVGVKG